MFNLSFHANFIAIHREQDSQIKIKRKGKGEELEGGDKILYLNTSNYPKKKSQIGDYITHVTTTLIWKYKSWEKSCNIKASKALQ